jgi:hypothetical protein
MGPDSAWVMKNSSGDVILASREWRERHPEEASKPTLDDELASNFDPVHLLWLWCLHRLWDDE